MPNKVSQSILTPQGLTFQLEVPLFEDAEHVKFQ